LSKRDKFQKPAKQNQSEPQNNLSSGDGTASKQPTTISDNPDRNKKDKTPYNFLNLIVTISAVFISVVAILFSCEQTKIAKETAEKQLRAYLGVDIAGCDWGIQPDSAFFAGFNIINYGQTPAKNVMVKGNIDIVPIDLPNNYKPIYYPIMSPETKFVVFPNAGDKTLKAAVQSKNRFGFVSYNQVSTFRSDIRIHIFLRIVYKDIFDKKRNTYFCSYFIPVNDTIKITDSIGWFWNTSAYYNDYY
jgi:hypothetical protein